MDCVFSNVVMNECFCEDIFFKKIIFYFRRIKIKSLRKI